MWKWRKALALVVVLALVILAGCSGSKAPETQPSGDAPKKEEPPKPVTLRFPSWQADEPGTSDWYKARIEDFKKKYPHVTIELTKVVLKDHIDKLATEFAANAAPTIVHLPAANFWQFAEKGWLEPLDDYLKGTDIQQNWTPLQDMCTYQGKTQCVVALTYGYSMIYNEKLLKDAGVDKAPTTFDELLAASKKVADPSKGIYGFGAVMAGGAVLTTHFNTWVIGSGAHFARDGKVTTNSPEMKKAFENWTTLVNSGAVPKGQESAQLRTLLTEGKLAFWFDGPWIWGNVSKARPEIQQQLKVAPLPFPQVMGGQSNVWAINKAATPEEKKLAWEFIAGGTTAEWQDKFAAATGSPPPRKGAMTDVTRNSLPFLKVYEEAGNKAVSYIPKGLEPKINEMNKLVADELQAVVAQNKPVDKSLADLQTALTDLQKQ